MMCFCLCDTSTLGAECSVEKRAAAPDFALLQEFPAFHELEQKETVASVFSFMPHSTRSLSQGQRKPRLWWQHSCLYQSGDFPGGSDSKASVYNEGDLGSIPGLGRSPGEGNDNPLQYYCLENPMDRGAWQATVHGVAMSWT